MISLLRGRPLSVHPEELTLDVGGVGYEIRITLSVYYALDRSQPDEVSLHIHTHVREEAIQLYGFLDVGEKAAFRMLLAISGVGPKLAITVLSGMSLDELGKAIAGNDRERFQKIPGVGRKTAERILLELKDRWQFPDQPVSVPATGKDRTCEEACSALTNLGYPDRAAHRAVEEVWDKTPEVPLAELIRSALARLL